jgi:hypothetical protein
MIPMDNKQGMQSEKKVQGALQFAVRRNQSATVISR